MEQPHYRKRYRHKNSFVKTGAYTERETRILYVKYPPFTERETHNLVSKTPIVHRGRERHKISFVYTDHKHRESPKNFVPKATTIQKESHAFKK